MQSTNNPKSNKSILMYSGIAAAVIIVGAGAFTLYSASQNLQEQNSKKDEIAMVKSSDVETKLSANDEKTSIRPTDSMSIESTDSNVVTNLAVNTPGEWKPFSNDLVSSASQDKKVVIFFNASWCSTCQSTVRDINANLSKLDPNLVLLSADYDKETSLRRKYGVTTQHTFVQVSANGDLVKKTVGLNNVNQINSFIN
jgi:thiol-disulfide isomerase/thioredoxin